MHRFQVINCDGTRNGRDDESPTNVLRFHRLVAEPHVSHYFAGPGNEDENNWLNEIAGAAFGVGSDEICDRAYNALSASYRPGDRVGLSGFSRGATNARRIASRVARDGVNGHSPDVYLFVWDTVAAFLPFGPGQQGTLFHDLHMHPKVIQARHAVALDEDRAAFAPNLMNKRDGVVETWFPGNHADVGGGYKDRGLADITLRWMIEQAKECGLTFEPLSDPAIPGQPHREDFPLRRETRRVGVKVDDEWSIGTQALIHHTAQQ